MNAKQAKLLRYFEKHSGKSETAKQIAKVFDDASHKTKGTITRFMKRVIVTRLAMNKLAEEREFAQMKAMLDATVKTMSEEQIKRELGLIEETPSTESTETA